MYACQESISVVVHQGATELHAGATFKVVPSISYSRQLLIIHLILQNHSIPICFVLIEAKTEASYRKVMERFKIKFSEVKPLIMMIDFESALRNVFLDVYAEAQISSSWFYFVQLIRKGPECFYVHCQPRRTDSDLESFHSTMKQTFQVMHPNLWTALAEIPEVDEYNEVDFIIPEDEELAIWEVNYDHEEVYKVPYAPVPENIMGNLPQCNKDETCLVCRDAPRTYALIPCVIEFYVLIV